MTNKRARPRCICVCEYSQRNCVDVSKKLFPSNTAIIGSQTLQSGYGWSLDGLRLAAEKFKRYIYIYITTCLSNCCCTKHYIIFFIV